MSKLESLITTQEARDLQRNWLESRGKILSKAIGRADRHDFLFSVEELQEFLNYIKEKSAYDNPGVRIYLGAYGPSIKDEPTIFLSPTKGSDSQAEDDYDIEPLNKSLSGFPPRDY